MIKIKDKKLIYLLILGIIFFFIYSFLPISQFIWQHNNLAVGEKLSLKFNTPDEVINYYFSNQLAKTGELYYFEPLDDFMHRVIFPRWALVINSRVTPGNFLGIDLIFGCLAKILSTGIIPFLTPFFAVIGVLFFYLLIKKIFNQQIAFVSSFLVLIFPGWWYYASRTMFPNVLFISLFLAGLYFLIKILEINQQEITWYKSLIFSILAGLSLGLALITRTSEVVWMFLIVLTILIFYFRHWRHTWPFLFLILAIMVACFVPVFYHNKILYNNYFFTGYNLNTMTENLESGAVGKLSLIKAVFLPFGFHPRVILSVIYNYFIKLFWPWLLLWLVGLIVFLKSNKTHWHKLYFIWLLVVSCWLLIVYGSWFFSDSVLAGPTLGSSYVRYFLPLYVFNLPLIALLLVKLWQKKLLIKTFSVAIGCWLLVIGVQQVFWRGPEALAGVQQQIIKYNIQAHDLLKKTTASDIILLDTSADKIFFPERQHIIVPQNGVEWPEIKRILPYQTVYYFHSNDKTNLTELNQTKFNSRGLEVSEGINLDGGGVIYTVTIK